MRSKKVWAIVIIAIFALIASGSVYAAPQRCNACSGTGAVVCGACKGSGSIAVGRSYQTCVSCRGTGLRACGACTGKGYVGR